MKDNKLEPCPFCGSEDIDPEGCASFKEECRNSQMTWDNHATKKTIEHKPACNNCGATTDGDWNTRAEPKDYNDPNQTVLPI